MQVYELPNAMIVSRSDSDPGGGRSHKFLRIISKLSRLYAKC